MDTNRETPSPTGGMHYFAGKLAEMFDPEAPTASEIIRPTTDAELQRWVHEHLGIWVSDVKVCPHHCAPLTAFADAYFARSPRAVWYGSRGFSGKSVLLAALSLTEAITLGAGVSLLGGSGEQSQRVHAYMQGDDPALPDTFWAHPNAPRHMLRADPSKRETRLSNRGYLRALMASQASVRGPHPHRLRGDEIDEMEQPIWDSAQGQPMESAGIREQVVGCSTWQNQDGTMTREMAEAEKKGWPIWSWCWRESIGGGWLTEAQVERKKAAVSAEIWEIEYDLGRPTIRGIRVFPAFDEHENVRETVDVGGDLLVAMDFNVDPMTAAVGVRVGDEMHWLEEIGIENSGTAEMCEELKRRYCLAPGEDPHRPVMDPRGVLVRKRRFEELVIYPDPACRQRKTSAAAGVTDYSLLIQAGFRVVVSAAAPGVADRVNETNAMWCNALGRRRMFAHPRCETMRKGFGQLQYKPGTSAPDKTRAGQVRIEHVTAAVGYLVHEEFPIVEGGMRKAVYG